MKQEPPFRQPGSRQLANDEMSPVRLPHLFVIGPVPPPYGGVGATVKTMLESELGEQFRITVVDTSKKDAREIVSDSRIYLRDGVYLLRTAIELGWKLARQRPDLAFLTPVADHSLLREALFVRMARLAGAGVVCQFHARYEGEFFITGARWARRLLGRLLGPADRILLLSDGLRRYFAPDFTDDKTGVLGNFIDTTGYRTQPLPRPARTGCTIFFLGRLSEQKGVWDLLQVIEPILAAAPDTRFVFGGVAEFAEVEREITEFITAHDLARQITLLGTVTGEAKLRAFAEADIFCLPSHLENQPIVLVEAMTAGLPVVSTRVGTIPEMIEEGEHGLLVNPRDRQGLAAALLRLLGDAELRQTMGNNGRQRALGEFDRRVAVARLTDELNAVHARRRGRRRRTSPAPLAATAATPDREERS